MNLRACAALIALFSPALGSGQVPVVAAAVPTGAVLRAGTAIPIRLLTSLTTEGKHLRAGDRFDIEVSAPVLMNGQTVIPVGSHGFGEVTSVRNKGMWGKSGNIEARLLYIRVGDRQIRVTGTFNDKGVTGTGAVVGALVLIPVAGFFMTGTSARIAQGAQVTAYLDEDVPVVLAGGAAAPPPLVSTALAPAVPAPIAPASTPPAATAGTKVAISTPSGTQPSVIPIAASTSAPTAPSPK